MGKTIADRLREYKIGDGWICWGSFLAEIMGDDEYSCPESTGDRPTCYVCYESQMRKLADAIEAEQRSDGVDVDMLNLAADALSYYTNAANDNHKDTTSIRCDVLRSIVGDIRRAVKGVPSWSDLKGILSDKKPQLPEGVEWPRFEDGELVKFGDEFLNNKGNTATVTRIALSEKHFTINKGQGRICKTYGNRIKRPEPEVLDADGVPIKVGDTVWYEDREWRVIDVHVCLDGEGGVNLESFIEDEFDEPAEGVGNAWNKHITHRKPDTHEAIEDDATVPAAVYCVRHGLVESDTDADDATLLELHILDLLRRQRKLLGGE